MASISPSAAVRDALKLLVVTNEVPFPSIHGGRVDVMRRLQALARQGAEISLLVTWCSEGELAGGRARAELEARLPVAHLDITEISRSWPARLKRLAGLWRQSLYVVTRALPAENVARLENKARELGAQVVLADGLFAGPLAMDLATRLGLPLVYRSHNIEHQYLGRQARLARGWRARVAHWLAARGVERLERALIRHARLVLDISCDDLAYWQAQGFGHVRWLPPYCPPLPAAGATLPSHDLAFLGNLFMPNNVEGLHWFVGEVWPRVLAARPASTLLIAGSRPSPDIVSLCRSAPRVTLLADVANVSDVYDCARVLINPVRQGSGVNMKALELLDTGKPVVSTGQGVKGLPAEHAALFELADEAAPFAERILALLARPDAARVAGSRLPQCYRPEAASELLDWLRACSAGHGSPA